MRRSSSPTIWRRCSTLRMSLGRAPRRPPRKRSRRDLRPRRFRVSRTRNQRRPSPPGCGPAHQARRPRFGAVPERRAGQDGNAEVRAFARRARRRPIAHPAPASQRSNRPSRMADDPREVPGEPQGGHHPVDAVRGLPHILEREDGPCRDDEPTGGCHGVHEGEVAAESGARRTPRRTTRSPSHVRAEGRVLEDRRAETPESTGTRRVPAPSRSGRAPRQPRLPQHRVQRGDVAEPHQPAADVARARPKGQRPGSAWPRNRREPPGSPLPGRRHGARHLRARRSSAAGQVTFTLEQLRPDVQPITRSQPASPRQSSSRGKRTGRRHHGHQVPRREWRRQAQRRCGEHNSVEPRRAATIMAPP